MIKEPAPVWQAYYVFVNLLFKWSGIGYNMERTKEDKLRVEGMPVSSFRRTYRGGFYAHGLARYFV
jgi:hypothetical protein